MKPIITLILVCISMFSFSQTHIEHVDAATFKKLIAERKNVLIDLRTNDELAKKGFIKDAKQIDYFSKDAEGIIKKLDRKKTYLIYCAGGGRSGECAELMKENGFSHVINLEKGFDDWKKKGFEIEFKK